MYICLNMSGLYYEVNRKKLIENIKNHEMKNSK